MHCVCSASEFLDTCVTILITYRFRASHVSEHYPDSRTFSIPETQACECGVQFLDLAWTSAWTRGWSNSYQQGPKFGADACINCASLCCRANPKTVDSHGRCNIWSTPRTRSTHVCFANARTADSCPAPRSIILGVVSIKIHLNAYRLSL